MERNFYTDDFEELLKEKADQYKMYPSDKVWNGIQNSLHSRRKWYWIGFALLLSGVSYYAIEALVAPPRAPHKSESGLPAGASSAGRALIAAADKTPPAPVIPLPPLPISRNTSVNRNTQPFYGVFAIDRSYAEVEPGATVKAVELLDPSVNSIAAAPVIALPETDASTIAAPAVNKAPSTLLPAESSPAKTVSPGIYPLNYLSATQPVLIDFKTRKPANIRDAEKGLAEAGNPFRFPVEEVPAIEDAQKINWLQEFALHQLSVTSIKRLSWQLSFAPTMNYRKLSTSKNTGSQYAIKNIPMAMNLTGDLENLVNHKPALGFELGTHLRYAVDRTVTLKTGIQFNYARYAIEAFNSPSADVATITLNSVGGSRADSLVSYSSISNLAGNSVKDLQNQYFQLSAPIGMEVQVIGGKRLQLRVAGTIQPTYLLNRNSYLITTDYQSYTHEPSLVRRWNVNTSAEAFLSYNTGTGITWQVGPQFRYQLLSSYSSRYPIRENLMEYGVKIGVSKTLR
jgi:hypothetical protein